MVDVYVKMGTIGSEEAGKELQLTQRHAEGAERGDRQTEERQRRDRGETEEEGDGARSAQR